MTDYRKQSLYFPDEMIREMRSEAKRLDRSMSWIVQQCWKVARHKISALPSQCEVETP